MSTQHTPGPWKLDPITRGVEPLDADGNPLMTFSRSSAELMANARLIAAAPDLLEALRNCLNWTHRSIDLEVSGSMQHAAKIHAAEAEAIIAKATGKEPA